MLQITQRSWTSARRTLQVSNGIVVAQSRSRYLSTITHDLSFSACPTSPYIIPCLPRITRPHAGWKRARRRYLQTSAAPDQRARFAYKIAAAFSAKGQPFDKDKYFCQYDSVSGRHTWAGHPLEATRVRARRHASGQDAFFIAGIETTGSVAFGVADGVGGWADQGIDSAEFAHGLCDSMHYTAASLFGTSEQGKSSLAPIVLLQAGYNRVCHDPKIAGGGSTACVAVAEPDGVLNVANLGDSGFVQLRLNAVHNYSQPQTHAFNTPYQLSQVPPRILAQIAKFGGRHPFQDMPVNADMSSHELRHGDVLVFATDGVWDNLSPEDLLRTVAASMKSSGAWTAEAGGAIDVSKTLLDSTDRPHEGSNGQLSLQTEIARNIVTKAKAASHDTRRDGPFARAAQKAFPHESKPWSGGKVDDICVVVAIVVDQNVGE